MLCASRKEPLGLPLQSIPLCAFPDGLTSQFARDDFGDSPRDGVLANLDGDGKSDFGVRESFWDSSVRPLPQLLSAHIGRGREGSSKGRRQQCSEDETTATDSTGSMTATDSTGSTTSTDSTPSPEPEARRIGAALRDWPAHVTTVMLRNIPNRYTAEELLVEMLAEGFTGTFDFFYLPIDFTTKRNRGYCFINFHKPIDSRRFVAAFHRQQLTRYSTQKILQVSPAMTQGLSANVAHFVKKDAQRIQNKWFRPMIFSAEGEDVALAQTARERYSLTNPCQEGPTGQPEAPLAHSEGGPTATPEPPVTANAFQGCSAQAQAAQ